MSVKITTLTASNVEALRDALTDEERERVSVTSTTATFDMPATDALRLVNTIMARVGQQHGTTHHPYKSFHAIVRKLRALD